MLDEITVISTEAPSPRAVRASTSVCGPGSASKYAQHPSNKTEGAFSTGSSKASKDLHDTTSSLSQNRIYPLCGGINTSAVAPARFVLYAPDADSLASITESIIKLVAESGCKISVEEQSSCKKSTFVTEKNQQISLNVGTPAEISRDSDIPYEISATGCFKTVATENLTSVSNENIVLDNCAINWPLSTIKKSIASSDSSGTLLSDIDFTESGSVISSSSSDSESSLDHSESLSKRGILMKPKMRRKFQSRNTILRQISQSKGEAHAAYLFESEMLVRANARKEKNRVVSNLHTMENDRVTVSDEVREISERTLFNTTNISSFDILGQRLSLSGRFYALPSTLFIGMNELRRTSTSKHFKGPILEGEGKFSPINYVRSWRRFFIFDFYHAVPGYITLMLYSAVHSSLYEIIYQIVVELTKCFRSQVLVHLLLLALALFLSRISGSIWNWLDDDLYLSAKFEMHNRLRLQAVDARFLQWLRRNQVLSCLMDIISLYLCSISVAYFLHCLALPAFADIRKDVIGGLPSMQYNYLTPLKSMLLKSTPTTTSSTAGNNTDRLYCFNEEGKLDDDLDNGTSNSCVNMQQLIEEDQWYLYSKVSSPSYYSLVGDPQSALMSPLGVTSFFIGSAVISIFLLFKRGRHFWY